MPLSAERPANRFEQSFARCPLPESVQVIAEVIGEAQALALLPQLPLVAVADKRQQKLHYKRSMYIPSNIDPAHPLVAMVGWQAAQLVSARFGGEVMQPAACHERFVRLRRDVANYLRAAGFSHQAVRVICGVSSRTSSRLWQPVAPIVRGERRRPPLLVRACVFEQLSLF